jgi:signal transduction histidine kinase
MIESGNNAVILIKIKEQDEFQGLLNRLKYSEVKVYNYSDNENFVDNNDEYLVIVADRFAACLFWEKTMSEILDLYQGFCSLNPDDSKKIIDSILQIINDKELLEDLNTIKQDRRSNEKFTNILHKFTESFENQQRDLICANTELQELHEKVNQSDQLISIGKLCSIIAHEIRNPLGMMDMYAKIIESNLNKVDNNEAKDSINNGVSIITKSIENLDNLLTEILNYSKPVKMNKLYQPIKPVIEGVIKLAEPLFQKNQVTLSLIYDAADDLEIECDSAKISQALLNLIKNALEVSSRGNVVQVKVSLNNDNDLSVGVIDHGTGMTQENIEKLFTPFYSTKEQGTGLGLVQVKNIIEAHGGEIKISSQKNTGTVFEILLHLNL